MHVVCPTVYLGSRTPLVCDRKLLSTNSDPPGKPRNLDIVDIDIDHITVHWNPPEDDGGTPILSYLVERRERSEKEWFRCGETPVSATVSGAGPTAIYGFTDKKVLEGTEYYYRVTAVNKAGPGMPSDHNRTAAKCRAKPREYAIARRSLARMHLFRYGFFLREHRMLR